VLVMEPAEQPPPVLLAQLVIGGRLVMPTLSSGGLRLLRVTRTGDATFDSCEPASPAESITPKRLAG
jgi:protein-L-isoaspartate O-methyltransferase